MSFRKLLNQMAFSFFGLFVGGGFGTEVGCSC